MKALLSLSCLLAGTVLFAQKPAATPLSLPLSDIIPAAKQNNGLGAVKQPWHLRVRYEIIAYDGTLKDSGTYEEFWVSPKQYKRSYAGAKFNQIDVATGSALYRGGDQDWPGLRESQVRTLLVQPVSDQDLRDFDLEAATRFFGGTELPCAVLNSKRKSNIRVIVIGQPIVSAHYCFERDMLRFASLGAGHDDTVFNNLMVFHGQYVAREIQLTNAKERLGLTVGTIEDLPTVNESDFTPPVGAVGPLGARGTISVKSASLVVLKRPFPVYPVAAKRNRTQGTIAMQVIIGKDGSVKSIEVVAGPSGLRQAAVESLRQWQFQPFLVLGDPVEVSTKIELAFTLN